MGVTACYGMGMGSQQMAQGLPLHQRSPTHIPVSPAESCPISCYSGIDNGTCGSKDWLYAKGDADEGHGDGHWPEKHPGHCLTEPTSNIKHVQVLSTVFTQFRVTECFNNLQTLVCVFSESFQCSFMASTPDFCLKLACPYLAPLSTIACPEDFHPSWSCPFSPPLLKCTKSNYLPDFPGCLVTSSIALTS